MMDVMYLNYTSLTDIKYVYMGGNAPIKSL